MSDLYFDTAIMTAMGSIGFENPRHYQEWKLSLSSGDEAIYLRLYEGNELIDVMRCLADGRTPIKASINIMPYRASREENET
jgi:hypothetical protein